MTSPSALLAGRFTVPVLWCKKLNTIVNNESSEIMRMLNSQFNEFATNPSLDLYPEDLRASIDDVRSRTIARVVLMIGLWGLVIPPGLLTQCLMPSCLCR